jgi:nicotinamide mononucleotide (NMN) deamidase PncC
MVEAFQNFLDKAEIETQNQIEVRLIELLKEKHLTLALAESLTGGMISSRTS